MFKQQSVKNFAASCANIKFYTPSMASILSQMSPLHIILLHFPIAYCTFFYLFVCVHVFQMVLFFGCFLSKVVSSMRVRCFVTTHRSFLFSYLCIVRWLINHNVVTLFHPFQLVLPPFYILIFFLQYFFLYTHSTFFPLCETKLTIVQRTVNCRAGLGNECICISVGKVMFGWEVHAASFRPAKFFSLVEVPRGQKCIHFDPIQLHMQFN